MTVSAAVTQRPEIFGAVIDKVPVIDMLRYQRFTFGNSWLSEYGDSNKGRHIRPILKYSPLHNVKKTKYPAIFVATGENDDRVTPFHSFKFVASL
jgi:prolyl oligopeptidase